MFSQFTAKPKDIIGEIAKKAETLGYTVTTLPGNCLIPMTANSSSGYSLTSTISSASYAWQLTNPYDNKYPANATVGISSGNTGIYWQATLPREIPINGMAIVNAVDPSYTSTGDSLILTVFVDDVEVKSVTFDTEWDLGERRCVMFDEAVQGKVVKMQFSTESTTPVKLSFCRIEVLSTDEPAYLLQSTGSSGLDSVNIYLDNGNYVNMNYPSTPYGNFINIVPLEDADPQTGNMKGMCLYNHRHATYSGASTISGTEGNREIEAILSITKDRIVLCTKGNSMNSTTLTTTTYVGLPSRFSNEPDSSAMLIGGTSWSENANSCRVMKNQLGQPFFRIITTWITSSVAPTSWGDKVFLSPAFLDGLQEGMRGELDGVKFTTNSGIVHGDEITVGSTKYFVTINTNESRSSFPTVAVLIDKSK